MKVIRLPIVNEIFNEQKNNINQLKALIDKYIPADKKKFVKSKIKDEQLIIK